MKIGFFGDSFCADVSILHTLTHRYETYIKKIKKHYNAEIVSLGKGGSSYWDVIIKQFPLYENNLPDVCIFVWTEHARIYHPTVRNIGPWVIDNRWGDIHYSKFIYQKYYKSASEFYKTLHDDEKSEKEMISALYYFDREVLKPLSKKTKIIHLWSFGKYKDFNQLERYHQNNISYIYNFQTGVECRPALKCFSMNNRPLDFNNDVAANHIEGNENNKLLSDMIIDAIDNYSDNKLLEYKL